MEVSQGTLENNISFVGFQVHPVAIPGVSTTTMGDQGGAVPRSSGDGGDCS